MNELNYQETGGIYYPLISCSRPVALSQKEVKWISLLRSKYPDSYLFLQMNGILWDTVRELAEEKTDVNIVLAEWIDILSAEDEQQEKNKRKESIR